MADIDLSAIRGPRAVALAATEKLILLDPLRKYTIVHLGIDASQNDDANSALSAFFHSATGLAANFTDSQTVDVRCLLDNSAMIWDGWGEHVDPVFTKGAAGRTTKGKTRIYMIGPTNADGMIQFEPHNDPGS